MSYLSFWCAFRMSYLSVHVVCRGHVSSPCTNPIQSAPTRSKHDICRTTQKCEDKKCLIFGRYFKNSSSPLEINWCAFFVTTCVMNPSMSTYNMKMSIFRWFYSDSWKPFKRIHVDPLGRLGGSRRADVRFAEELSMFLSCHVRPSRVGTHRKPSEIIGNHSNPIRMVYPFVKPSV